MNGLTLLLTATACFLGGYFVYSRLIGKVLGIDSSRKTPAHTRRDGCDYVPAHPTVLFGHHFAAIAGAGPIVGPVLAAQFGWASVALWIILGCIFIGAVHDMIAMFLSVRHNGESIGSVVGTVLGKPGRVMFLLFCVTALILVIAEFTRQISLTFVADPSIASASLLFIAEAIVFGLCVYRLKMSVLWASLIFVPLMFAFVWIGKYIPLDLVKMLGVSEGAALMIWQAVLLVYCYFASTCPVWILLQPRDYLNAYLLYAMMALGFLGVIVAKPVLEAVAFSGFSVTQADGGVTYLFPFLFVTVACGACSGFHALVASGTSAKQLDNEKSIRPIAYGGMLLEGVLAIIALIGIASMYGDPAKYAANIANPGPVSMFAASVAGFCTKLGIPVDVARGFMLLSVSAFLMTTVDAGTRLARFTWQELVASTAKDEKPSGACGKTLHNMYVGTFIIVVAVCGLLFGNPKMAKSLWTIFASANQLLAALTLLTATMWFAKNGKPCRYTLLPMLLMMGVSSWALVSIFRRAFAGGEWLLTSATGFLLLVAIALIVFSISKVCNRNK